MERRGQIYFVFKTYDDGTTSAQHEYDDAYRKTSEAVDYGSFQLTNTATYYKDGSKKTYTGRNLS